MADKKPQMSRRRPMLLSNGVNGICYISEHGEPTLISVKKNNPVRNNNSFNSAVSENNYS